MVVLRVMRKLLHAIAVYVLLTSSNKLRKRQLQKLKPYLCLLGKGLNSTIAKMDDYLFTYISNGKVNEFIEGLESKWQERNKHFKELQADLVAAVEQRQVRKENMQDPFPTWYR